MQNILVPIQEIIPALNLDELASLEEISRDTKGILRERNLARENILASDSTNTREFVWELLHYTDYRKEAMKNLKDQVVIDLGAGPRATGYALAVLSEARAYVGVEPFNYFRLYKGLIAGEQRNDKDYCQLYVDKKDIPASLVTDDMLTFLRRLPKESSGCLLTSGIDRIISLDEYRKLVEVEIGRVLSPDRKYLAWKSAFNPLGLRKQVIHENLFSVFTKT